MATGGKKPKSPRLRLLDGTHRTTRHGDAGEARERAEKTLEAFGPVQCPSYLKNHAREAWQRYIAPASWLDGSREPAAVAFCELWSEFRDDPAAFPASRHGQMRAYMADLGLTDERARPDEDDAEKDEFFDE